MFHCVIEIDDELAEVGSLKEGQFVTCLVVLVSWWALQVRAFCSGGGLSICFLLSRSVSPGGVLARGCWFFKLGCCSRVQTFIEIM